MRRDGWSAKTLTKTAPFHVTHQVVATPPELAATKTQIAQPRTVVFDAAIY
jgi:hypothetical protein